MKDSIRDHLLPAWALRECRSVRRRLNLRRIKAAIASARTQESGLKIATIGGFDVAFRPNTADEAVMRQSFDNDIFLKEIRDFTISHDAIIVDVGAHIGTFSMFISKKTPRGCVFAVEASLDSFNIASMNCKLNQLENVVIEHVALAGETGLIQLHHDPDGNWGHSIVKALSHHSAETVAATTLVEFMERHSLGGIDLIKFNCEGAEFPILLNCPVSILSEIKKMIILYHLYQRCDLTSPENLHKLVTRLQEAGFEVEIKNRAVNSGWIIATLKPRP
jgi:FkbM family methyltransferase